MASDSTPDDSIPGALKSSPASLEVNCMRRFEDLATRSVEAEECSTLMKLEESLRPAEVLEELGYGSSGDALQILGLFLPLDERGVAMIIGMASRTHLGLNDVHGAYSTLCSVLCSHAGDSSWLSTWDLESLVDAIKELAPNLNWLSVIRNLDHEGFFVPDQKALSVLMMFYTRNCRDSFPVHAVCGNIWKNHDGQLSFLRQAALASPEVFSFANSHGKLALLENYHKFFFGSPNHAWLSVDLIETLCRLAELGHGEAVRSLLEYPAKHCPELLLAGLAQVKADWNVIQTEYFTLLLSAYFGVNPNSTLVVHQLWNLNREAVIRAIVDIHFKDPSTVTPILNMCQELKILSILLEGTPFHFCIDLASLASRREFLNLEKWLTDNLEAHQNHRFHQNSFFKACLNFLREKLQADSLNGAPRSTTVGLLPETAAVFIKALQPFSPHVSREFTDEFRRLQALALRANPRLLNVEPESFSSDIEEEANAFFQKIYSEELSIANVVEMLERFMESSNAREHEIFSCMIQSLFDEYRFFPRYPEKELRITAVLFGKLISHQLVSSITLGVALRCVLDALRKPPDSRMFSFGITALEQFKSRLEEWPQYCNHILQISHMREGQPELVDYIERSLLHSSSSQADPGSNISTSDTLSGQLEQGPEVSQPSNATIASNPIQQTSLLQLQQQEERPRSAGAALGLSRSLTQTSSSMYDMVRGQKPTQSPLPSAQTFAKPSRTTSVPVRQSSTPGFGHALNIETLVAAAEKREPVEIPAPEIEDKVLFIINNISLGNLDVKSKECLEVVKESYFPWFAQYMVMKRASIEPNFHDLYLKFLDMMNSRSLSQEIVNATYQNCKVLLGSDLIKSSSEERSLLKNLGSWLGKLTIGRNRVLKAKEIDPKTLIMEAYERGLMIAVIPFTSKILEPCHNSAAYQPPNPWTMGILGLLAEIYALPNLKMNLKFDIEVLFKNLNVDLKEVKPTQLLKNKSREVEGNPDFSNKDLTVSHQPSPAEHTSIISSLNQVEFLPELPAPTSHPITHPSSTSQLTVHVTTQEDEKVVAFGGDRLSKAVSVAQTQSSSAYLNSYVVLNPRLAANQQLQIQLQRFVPPAMERAIREIIAPVVDRSVTIACMTSRELIQKDFALEADDNRMVHSANLMVASLAGSLAHVTCKEPLRLAMMNHIRNSLQQTALNSNAELLEQAVLVLTNDNLDLGCAVIEKSATEKALRDLEDAMTSIIVNKRNAREALLQAYTQGALSRLPEALRPKPGRLSHAQQKVYEDFARLPWQNQTASSTSSTLSRPNNYSVFTASHSASQIQAQDITSEELDGRTPSPTSFSDGGSRHQDVPVDVSDGAGTELGKLLVPNVLQAPAEPAGGVSSMLQDAGSELYNVMDALGKVSQRPGSLDSLQQLAEITKNNAVQNVIKDDKNDKKPTLNREPKDEPKPLPRDTDPAGLREQVAMLFDEWARLCNAPGANEKAMGYISQLSQAGFLKGDDVTDRFFRILTELAVTYSLSEPATVLYPALDSYAKLVVFLVKYHVAEPAMSKVGLLTKILTVTARVIQMDANEKKTAFQPRPYFRLFFTWLVDFNSPDPALDSNNFQLLVAFSNVFAMLQPLHVPALSFVWLELISHRMFMPKQLMSHSQKGWPLFQRLLVALFKFMDPYLRSAELSDPIRLLYKGTLRVLLVLLHDFPEFLCEYHFSFCDVIPPSCIQMRNLILSAFPRNMRLPDPFTPNLKVDLLPEISQPPRILSDVEHALKAKQLKGEVDEYLKTRQSLSLFLVDLKPRLMLSQAEASASGTRYNVPLINSLVLYVGMQAIQQLQSKTTPQQLAVPTAPITHSAPMDIFQKLIVELDTEGRYLFLNAIANQLRYPNNHTHYFSCVLLYLFAEANQQEIIQEQITRVLLERLIVNRPHPWGLLITFIELIKNPRYSFWTHGFTRCAPEIERLFDSVARSCMGPPVKANDDELSAGLASDIKV